ncbi:hypothetical protein CALCODRAFT_486379 [Calocera cornea HHB12733]|uniref:Uncharacterized protein n=1 Tax=Calocera cornea HHB12733 TaxID=1353952 RepID=A0A165DS04_9BASI|nr:hypothetical protein CALCODRAFT_486379 [Calocera cornea HHB12733]
MDHFVMKKATGPGPWIGTIAGQLQVASAAIAAAHYNFETYLRKTEEYHREAVAQEYPTPGDVLLGPMVEGGSFVLRANEIAADIIKTNIFFK